MSYDASTSLGLVMLKTCEMVTSDLLWGQFTKDQYLHYFRHDTEGA
jgi:hypothetical protein